MTGSGFTLLEMLVVVLIMGLFVGMAAGLARPDDRALLRVEAGRLAQLLDLAATRARLGGRSIAWTADAAGYRFWQFSEDTGWSEIRDDDSLRARALPQGMAISGLRVENAASPETMRLEFGASGATLAFGVELSLGAARDTITGSPVGDVRVSSGEAANDDVARR
jgi:general secretion pathway protein H